MSYPLYKKQLDSLSAKQKLILNNKIPYLEKIDGWLLVVEAIELFRLATSVKSVRPVICEIGSWKGKSSYVFASAMKVRKGILYSIDPFTGVGDSASAETYQNEIKKMSSTLQQNFEDTMNRYGLRNFVTILPTLSESARSGFTESQIDILFIDGNHEYELVKKDYKLWSDLIVSGGHIILHDVKANHVDGPEKVFQEIIADSSMWKDGCIIGEMGIATKI